MLEWFVVVLLCKWWLSHQLLSTIYKHFFSLTLMEGQKMCHLNVLLSQQPALLNFLLLMDSATRTIKAGLDSAPNT